MKAEEMFEVFGDFDPLEHEAEATASWPETYSAATERTSNLSKEQWRNALAAGETAAAKLAAAMSAGLPAGGEVAMDAAEEHRLFIDRWFYPCPPQAHAGLADMYLTDARFEKYWDDKAAGLADYVHAAIHANQQRSAP